MVRFPLSPAVEFPLESVTAPVVAPLPAPEPIVTLPVLSEAPAPDKILIAPVVPDVSVPVAIVNAPDAPDVAPPAPVVILIAPPADVAAPCPLVKVIALPVVPLPTVPLVPVKVTSPVRVTIKLSAPALVLTLNGSAVLAAMVLTSSKYCAPLPPVAAVFSVKVKADFDAVVSAQFHVCA